MADGAGRRRSAGCHRGTQCRAQAGPPPGHRRKRRPGHLSGGRRPRPRLAGPGSRCDHPAMGNSERAGQRRGRQPARRHATTGRRFLQAAAGRLAGRVRPEPGRRRTAAGQVFGESMLAAGTRKHHQHRLHGRHDAAVAGRRLFGGQGGGHQPDSISRPRVGHPGPARQRDQPGFLPGRTEPGPAFQPRWQLHAARRADHRPYADGPLRRSRRNWRARSSGWRPGGRRRSSPARTSSSTADFRPRRFRNHWSARVAVDRSSDAIAPGRT